MNKPGRPRVDAPIAGRPRMNLYVPSEVKESLCLWCREIEDQEGDGIPRSLNWLAVEILSQAVEEHFR